MQRGVSILVCHIYIHIKGTVSLASPVKVCLDDFACKLELSLSKRDMNRQAIL